MKIYTSSGSRVLVVDDEPLIGEAAERTLRSYGYTVSVVSTAEEALQFLANHQVDICLSDLHLPGIGGKAFLQLLRQQHPDIPVVVMTGDYSIETMREILDLGVSDYVAKPWRTHELPIVIERNIRRHRVWMQEQKRYLCKLNEAYSDMLEAMLSALEIREKEIEGHCERVTAFTMVLAEAMGVPHQQYPDLERGALLHDVGKIGIPDRILFKKGPLNATEWEIMRQHPVIGYRLCMRVQSLQKAASEIVLCHHERWDGGGYPQGLRGEDIPLGARIFAVADTLDAMTSNRPYRDAVPIEEVFADLERCAGTQFDPHVVEACFSIPTGVWETLIQSLKNVAAPLSVEQEPMAQADALKKAA